MTGDEFKTMRKSLCLTLEQLGVILGVQKKTIINQEKSEKVKPLYEFSIRYLLVKSKRSELEEASKIVFSLL